MKKMFIFLLLFISSCSFGAFSADGVQQWNQAVWGGRRQQQEQALRERQLQMQEEYHQMQLQMMQAQIDSLNKKKR